MDWKKPQHPVWDVAQLAIVNLTVLFALWLITSEWDGEIGVLVGAALTTGTFYVFNRMRMSKLRE